MWAGYGTNHYPVWEVLIIIEHALHSCVFWVRIFPPKIYSPKNSLNKYLLGVWPTDYYWSNSLCILFYFDTAKGTSDITPNAQFILKGLSKNTDN